MSKPKYYPNIAQMRSKGIIVRIRHFRMFNGKLKPWKEIVALKEEMRRARVNVPDESAGSSGTSGNSGLSFLKWPKRNAPASGPTKEVKLSSFWMDLYEQAINPRGGLTEMEIIFPNGERYEAKVRCSDDDVFERRTGIGHCYGEILTEIGLAKIDQELSKKG